MAHQTWSKDEADYAYKLWQDGKSASIIAKAMFEKFNRYFSRNAVIGKIHRDFKEGAERVRTQVKKVGAYEMAKGSNVDVTIKLADAGPNHCRYSQDTGIDMRVCGKKTHKHYPYCEECCNIAYRKFGKEREVKDGTIMTGDGVDWKQR